MENQSTLSRRSAMASMAGAAGVMMATTAHGQEASSMEQEGALKGRLKQSVCRWCYGRMPLDDLCAQAAGMGLKAIDLLDEKDWAVPKKHGLICAMANGPGQIPRGWNRVQDHDRLVEKSEGLLPLVAEAGVPNMIVFSGNRAGLSDAEGLKNCAKGLKRITGLAEKLGVTVCMELLNSKRDHKDYQCDHTQWGADLVAEVGSGRFKLLYDIYHMQIMEGNLTRTIQANLARIGHMQLGDNPGRHEPGTGEINFSNLLRFIDEAGYNGWIGCEYYPASSTEESLKWVKSYLKGGE